MRVVCSQPLPGPPAVLDIFEAPFWSVWPSMAANSAGMVHSSAPVSTRPMIFMDWFVCGFTILMGSHGRLVSPALPRKGKLRMGISRRGPCLSRV